MAVVSVRVIQLIYKSNPMLSAYRAQAALFRLKLPMVLNIEISHFTNMAPIYIFTIQLFWTFNYILRIVQYTYIWSFIKICKAVLGIVSVQRKFIFLKSN